MSGPAAPVYLTATGLVTSADRQAIIDSVTLRAVGAAATVTLREGGAGGTVFMALSCTANDSKHAMFPNGLTCKGDLHATLTGAGVEVMVALR